jgi:hypothetical protein
MAAKGKASLGVARAAATLEFVSIQTHADIAKSAQP